MKKIIVVSENARLSSFLITEINQQKLNDLAKLDFFYTHLNKDPAEMVNLGAKKINLKDQEIIKRILEKYDMAFSLHCKQIFPAKLVNNLRCINFHPGFNPFNRGWYPQVFSILNKLPTGATIHFMDEEIDNGEIIDQKEISVDFSDTSLELYEKIITCEKELIRRNLSNIIRGKLSTKPPVNKGNYNDISDFNSLCELNLKNLDTLENHINMLKALTHGDFNNAYVIHKNKKYFLKLSIEEDRNFLKKE